MKINTSYYFEAMLDSSRWVKTEEFRKLGTSSKESSLEDQINSALSDSASFDTRSNLIGNFPYSKFSK